jgi:hypothetical protein
LRGLILIALVCGVVVLVSPFLISSLYIDQRGIEMAGRVYSKREDITMRYAGWTRTSEVTVGYDSPEPVGVAFFAIRMDPERYDTFHVGDKVRLHYLRHSDIPDVPGANILWQMHALPVVRLADQRAFSGLEMFFTRKLMLGCAGLAAIAVLLWVWRRARLPGFGWAVGACVIAGIPVLFFYDFPRPTAAPTVQVRQTAGKVKSLDRIDKLFAGSRSRGMIASQPVEVVGIEFVPEGRTDAVLAVDLIDLGSIAGLKVNGPVHIEYEGGSPRTAYLRSATRGFLARNLRGIVVDGGLYLGVLIGGLMGAHFIGRAWTRMVARR